MLIFVLFAFTSALNPICDRPATYPEDPYGFPVNCTGLMGSYTDYKIPSEILFMEYNMNEAANWANVTEKIQNLPVIPSVIFISEIDRGCGGSREFRLELMAQALKMDYAYGPEYLEFNQADGLCTTGNGILSKFPLDSVELTVFHNQCCWYPGRLGGRSGITVKSTIKDKPVTFSTAHLESGFSLENEL